MYDCIFCKSYFHYNSYLQQVRENSFFLNIIVFSVRHIFLESFLVFTTFVICFKSVKSHIMELRNLQAIYTMTISLLMKWLGNSVATFKFFFPKCFFRQTNWFLFQIAEKTGRGGGIAVPNHSIIHKLYRKICNYFKADIACKCLNSMTRNLTLLLIKKTGAGLSGVLCEIKSDITFAKGSNILNIKKLSFRLWIRVYK